MKPRCIFLPPGIDPLPGFEQNAEPMGIHPLRSESCVGRFYKRVVRRVAGMREVDLEPVLIRPQIHRLAGELAAIVVEQQLR